MRLFINSKNLLSIICHHLQIPTYSVESLYSVFCSESVGAEPDGTVPSTAVRWTVLSFFLPQVEDP